MCDALFFSLSEYYIFFHIISYQKNNLLRGVFHDMVYSKDTLKGYCTA